MHYTTVLAGVIFAASGLALPLDSKSLLLLISRDLLESTSSILQLVAH
jgi:hypothetical protein